MYAKAPARSSKNGSLCFGESKIEIKNRGSLRRLSAKFLTSEKQDFQPQPILFEWKGYSDMSRSSTRLLWSFITVIVATTLLLTYAYLKLSEANQEFLANKMAHEAKATVKYKEHVIVDETNRSFVNGYNDPIELDLGTEQWRVYYQIENFGGPAEPRLNRAVESEKVRVANFGCRFSYNNKEWYDKIEVGDALEVTYRVFTDGEVEVISVENPKYPALH